MNADFVATDSRIATRQSDTKTHYICDDIHGHVQLSLATTCPSTNRQHGLEKPIRVDTAAKNLSDQDLTLQDRVDMQLTTTGTIVYNIFKISTSSESATVLRIFTEGTIFAST